MELLCGGSVINTQQGISRLFSNMNMLEILIENGMSPCLTLVESCGMSQFNFCTTQYLRILGYLQINLLQLVGCARYVGGILKFPVSRCTGLKSWFAAVWWLLCPYLTCQIKEKSPMKYETSSLPSNWLLYRPSVGKGVLQPSCNYLTKSFNQDISQKSLKPFHASMNRGMLNKKNIKKLSD